MGSSNSVPSNLQGTYHEQCKIEITENEKTEFSYKLILKETEFELTQTQTNIKRKQEGGGSFNIVKMALLQGSVKKEDVGKEIHLIFTTKNASFQEGGGMMGVPLPDESHKVDFTMKYCELMTIDETTKTPSGTHHGLNFVTYPKLKFNELKGFLKGNKI